MAKYQTKLVKFLHLMILQFEQLWLVLLLFQDQFQLKQQMPVVKQLVS